MHRPAPAGNAAPARAVRAEGRFWSVSGSVDATTVALDPVFEYAVAGRTDSGAGAYRIDVRGPGGTVLYSRYFTPASAQTETTGADIVGKATFSELVPVTPGAAELVVLGPAGSTLAVRPLGGKPPVVRLAALPAGPLSGLHDVAWTVLDPDSTTFSARVLYSRDDGRTWSQIGAGDGLRTLAVDFDSLSGSTGSARLKVLVSDGANTGVAVSPRFAVARKLPTAEIVAPPEGMAVPREALVQFEAAIHDVDDGMLDGTAVQWTSDLDGPLGTGAVLNVTTLRPGRHVITLSAKDADGNPALARTTVAVAGSPPQVDLTVTPLDTLPMTCMEASIGARADAAVDLAGVEYSLDGGTTWTEVPLARLPYKFILPGSGAGYLIARALDTAGQVTARDSRFFTQAACRRGG